ncbi:hypothetical protein [Azospirillum endophyticum]
MIGVLRQADVRNVEIELEGDLVALLSLGLGAKSATAGAAEAAGIRKQVRSKIWLLGQDLVFPEHALRVEEWAAPSIKSVSGDSGGG